MPRSGRSTSGSGDWSGRVGGCGRRKMGGSGHPRGPAQSRLLCHRTVAWPTTRSRRTARLMAHGALIGRRRARCAPKHRKRQNGGSRPAVAGSHCRKAVYASLAAGRLPSAAHGERGPVRPAVRTMCSDRSRGFGRLRAQSATIVCASDCIEQGSRWSVMYRTARSLIVLPAAAC